MNEPPSEKGETPVGIDLTGMFWTSDIDGIELWYPDGDFLARIEDNLGLELAAEDVARYLCDLPVRLASQALEIERLRSEKAALQAAIDEANDAIRRFGSDVHFLGLDQ